MRRLEYKNVLGHIEEEYGTDAAVIFEHPQAFVIDFGTTDTYTENYFTFTDKEPAYEKYTEEETYRKWYTLWLVPYKRKVRRKRWVGYVTVDYAAVEIRSYNSNSTIRILLEIL